MGKQGIMARYKIDHGSWDRGRGETRDIMGNAEITDKGKWYLLELDTYRMYIVHCLYNMYTQMNSPDYQSYSGKTRSVSFDRSLWLTNAWITFWKKISIDLMIWSSKQDYNQQIRRDVEVIFFSFLNICPFSFTLVWRGVWSRSVCVSADCCGWDLRY